MTGAEAERALAEATRLHNAGELARAEVGYRALLQHYPDHPSVLHQLGVLTAQRGDPSQGAGLVRRAIERYPDCADYHYDLGKCLAVAGDQAGAASAFGEALRRAPGHAPAGINLGAALRDLGRPAEAEVVLRRVLAADPRSASARNNLGLALRDRGRLVEAAAELRRAVESAPEHVEARNNLALVLQSQGDLPGAARELEQAIALQPGRPVLLGSLSGVLRQLGRAREAHALLERAVAAEPGNAALLLDLGRVRADVGPLDLALEALEAALARTGDGSPGDAIDRRQVLFELAVTAAALCDWDRVERHSAELVGLVRARGTDQLATAWPPFLQLALPVPADVELAVAASYAAGFARVAACEPAPSPAAPAAGDRLRIGYLSPDLTNHPVGMLVAPLPALHSRDRFEVYAYALPGAPPDDRTEEIAAGVDHFVALDGLSDAAAAQRIRDDGVHVLIDLAGYTGRCRPGVLAREPAPVQAGWLGYSSTLAAPFERYHLGTRMRLGPAAAEWFSEVRVHLPESSLALPRPLPPRAELSRSEEGLPEDATVFACFNHARRIDRRVFSAWLRILAGVEGSVLWLIAGEEVAGRLRAAAAREGVAPERLVFAWPELMSGRWRHRLADLWLDTFTLSGGTAGVLCACAGLPVVTRIGRAPSSCVGADVAASAGMGELVVEDVEAYVSLAVELGRDRDRLAALRRRLSAEADGAPLFRPRRFVRHLEAAFELMWEHRASGSTERTIDVPPIDDSASRGAP